MTEPTIVRIGHRTPTRTIWSSCTITAVLIAVFGTQALLGAHPQQAPLVLMFLLLPAIAIPAVIALNTSAEINTGTWLVSINGGTPRPLAELRYCTVNVFRGVCTLSIGFGPSRRERVMVSSHTPFGSPLVERDWIRYLLPYTGLPRDPNSTLSAPLGSPYEKHATLEQALAFAHEYLK